MNRKIAFRAWDKVNKKMQYSGIVWGDYDFPVLSGLNYGDNINNLSNLMQYTGLKDKNGKEIYEGDIYEVGDLLYRVKCINGAFCGGILYYNDNDFAPLGFKFDRSEEDIILDNDTTFINVIGNIYENPELLDK